MQDNRCLATVIAELFIRDTISLISYLSAEITKFSSIRKPGMYTYNCLPSLYESSRGQECEFFTCTKNFCDYSTTCFFFSHKIRSLKHIVSHDLLKKRTNVQKILRDKNEEN